MVPSVFNIFLSAALFILPTLAADATVGTQSNAVNYGTGGSIIGLIVLILDIIVFVEIFKSSRPPLNKLLWVLLVFFFPILGLIAYYLFSARDNHAASSGGYEQIA